MARLDRYPCLRLSAAGDAGREGIELEAALADSGWRRMLGLALLSEPPERGLLIPRCASVHTFGMRFAIDVAFVAWGAGSGEEGIRVLDLRPGLAPRRLAKLARGLRPAGRSGIAALELAAGRVGGLGIKPGVELAVERLGSS